MNTRTLYIIIIVFFSINVFGTDYQITQKIQWKDSLNQSLTCSKAVYFKESGDLPFFSDMIELSYDPTPLFTINGIQKSRVVSKISQKTNALLTNSTIQCSFIVEKSGSKYLLKYWFPLLSKNMNGEISKIDNISITISFQPHSTLKSSTVAVSQIENSRLASGKWYKFEVIKNGVYKITRKDLSNLGIAVSKSVRVFTFPKNANAGFNKAQMVDDLYEIPISYNDGGDGIFDGNDYLLFYGESADNWYYNSTKNFIDHTSNPYSLSNFYYLLVDDGVPLKIQDVTNTANPDYTTTTYDNVDYYEEGETSMLKSGKQLFEPIRVDGIKFSFTQMDGNSVNFKVRAATYQSLTDNILTLSNSSDFSQNITIPKRPYLTDNTDWFETSDYFSKTVNSASLTLSLDYLSNSSESNSMLHDIVINYKSKLIYNGKEFLFRDINTFKHSYNSKYSFNGNASFNVWNVSNENNPINIQLLNESTGKSFVYKSDTIETFVAFNSDDCFKPTFKGVVENQNLHGNKNVSMIIVTADDFVSQANQLKDLHNRLDGIQTIVVTQNQISNEFSGGRLCPEGIRDFVRYIYNKGGNNLKFLLLLGDGSYNNKNINTANSILTFQTYESLIELSSIITDDFYGLLDVGEGISGNTITGALDIAIGRIPVSTVDDANTVINKITGYTNSSKSRGDWRNRIVFVADDADPVNGVFETIHMSQANDLADQCVTTDPSLVVSKIFLDAFSQVSIAGGQRYPSVNKTIESTIKNGCLLFNYTGHGNPLRLASEIVVDKSEVDIWENPDALPVFITAACQIGRFDDNSEQSLGESILLSNHGGGIALMTTTRSVYSQDNVELNSKIYNYMFQITSEGKPQYLGQVLELAKNKAVSDNFNKHNFIFLGDPAVRLNLPVYNVVTDKINGISVTSKIDTLKALSSVTIAGHIEDLKGNILNSYNGTIHAIIFDKPQNITTLSNEGNPPVTFKAQNNILFRGKVTVSNGSFLISFIVPKDIFYFYGYGRISYYSDNGVSDGAGNFQKVVVGGASNKLLDKNGGPKINLFLNDTNFVFGGITSASPTLLIKTKDNYGINVSGTSVGHDATATIDGNKSEQVIINQFYESDQNSYQKGMFRYPISSLSTGSHSVNVSVWNINNESSVQNLDFSVEESANLALSHVLNYPNPFTTHTDFYFEQNQTNQTLDVMIQIFTITGKLIKTITTNYYTEGNRSIPISWDGRDDFGDPIGRGVYVYKVSVRNEKQQIAQKYEKLVILK